MALTIHLPAVLAERAGGARVVQASGTNLGEVLERIASEYPDLVEVIRGRGGLSRFVNVYVDNVDVRASGGLATTIPADAEIVVVPAVAGG